MSVTEGVADATGLEAFGLRAGVALLAFGLRSACIAAYLALFAAFRSAFVNLRPVSGQCVGVNVFDIVRVCYAVATLPSAWQR